MSRGTDCAECGADRMEFHAPGCGGRLTPYLAAMRQRLLDRFAELPDIQENKVAFKGIADLIQWIDDHPNATPEQYAAHVDVIKGNTPPDLPELSQWGVPSNVARCRECPAWVTWVTTRKGNLMPVNQDDTSHFANCPGAGKRRKLK